MNKLASFDLEIMKTPEEGKPWNHADVGISCLEVLRGNQKLVWESPTGIQKDVASLIVNRMIHIVRQGYKLLTVNGTAFDFRVLAEVSGMYQECSHLALHSHVDLLLIPFCHVDKGWMVGANAFMKGAGVEGKLKSVTLNNGEVMEGMDGAAAPTLWFAGEYDAVLAYLHQDCLGTLQATKAFEKWGEVKWHSKNGREHFIGIGHTLPTAYDCLVEWPKTIGTPDRSWMSSPMYPEDTCAWALDKMGKGG